jgi:hypothetical protein
MRLVSMGLYGQVIWVMWAGKYVRNIYFMDTMKSSGVDEKWSITIERIQPQKSLDRSVGAV